MKREPLSVVCCLLVVLSGFVTTLTLDSGRENSAAGPAHEKRSYGDMQTFNGIPAGTVSGYASWVNITGGITPCPRYLGGMAYSKKDSMIILFGGYANASYLADTWVFDLKSLRWSHRFPSSSPPTGMNPKLVYDEKRNCVLMFSGFLDKMWSYDVANNSWTWSGLSNFPPQRSFYGSAYDAAKDRFVVFGGQGLSNMYMNDTWVLNIGGRTWTNVTKTVAPIGRHAQVMTFDRNSGAAYEAMRRAFPTWEGVMNAAPDVLEAALRPGGLARMKSRCIQDVLRALAARGELNLDYLAALPPAAAEEELLKFRGVGRKTARCVLLFALHKDVFPIDTHIERVLKRLGVIPESMSAEKAHTFIGPAVPEGRCLALHLNLIAHGRAVCHARNPECGHCILGEQCLYRRAHTPP